MLVSILAPECISTKTKSDKSHSAVALPNKCLSHFNQALGSSNQGGLLMKKKKTFCGQKAFIFFPFCACFCEECVSNSFTRAVSFFLFCQPDNWHWKGELNLWRRALVSLGLSACQRNTTAPRLSNPFHEIFKEMGSINQNDSSLWRFINGASSHRVVSVGLKSCLNRIIQNTYTTEGTLG